MKITHFTDAELLIILAAIDKKQAYFHKIHNYIDEKICIRIKEKIKEEINKR